MEMIMQYLSPFVPRSIVPTLRTKEKFKPQFVYLLMMLSIGWFQKISISPHGRRCGIPKGRGVPWLGIPKAWVGVFRNSEGMGGSWMTWISEGMCVEKRKNRPINDCCSAGVSRDVSLFCLHKDCSGYITHLRAKSLMLFSKVRPH